MVFSSHYHFLEKRLEVENGCENSEIFLVTFCFRNVIAGRRWIIYIYIFFFSNCLEPLFVNYAVETNKSQWKSLKKCFFFLRWTEIMAYSMNKVYSLDHRNIRFMKEKSHNLDFSPSKLTSSAGDAAVRRISCRNQNLFKVAHPPVLFFSSSNSLAAMGC